MNKKHCEKFEELFLQEDETELLEHIKSCEDCRREYEKMQAVSNLVKEAKPLFKKERFQKRNVALSIAAGFTFFILAGFVVMSWLPNYNYDQAVASELYPEDEYGLIALY